MKRYQLHVFSVCRQLFTVAIATVSLACPPQSAFAEDGVGEKQKPATIIHVGRNVAEVAQTLISNFDEDEQLSIGIDKETNVLILRGNEHAVSRAASALKVIDQPQKTVNIKVSIAVTDDSGKDQDQSQRIVDQLELTTLDGHKARLQFGQQLAIPTGVNSFPGNRLPVRNYSQQQVGTIIEVQPQVSVHGIQLQLEVEKSWVDSKPATDSSESEVDVIEQHTTLTTSMQTTLLLSDGVAQTVRAKVTSQSGFTRNVLITIEASTDKARSTDRAAVVREPGERATGGASSTADSSRGSSRSGSRGGFSGPRPGTQSSRPNPSRTGFGTPVSTEQILRLFNSIDRDNDQRITAEEIEAHPYARTITSRGFGFPEGMTSEEFHAQFQKFSQPSKRTGRD